MGGEGEQALGDFGRAREIIAQVDGAAALNSNPLTGGRAIQGVSFQFSIVVASIVCAASSC